MPEPFTVPFVFISLEHHGHLCFFQKEVEGEGRKQEKKSYIALGRDGRELVTPIAGRRQPVLFPCFYKSRYIIGE